MLKGYSKKARFSNYFVSRALGPSQPQQPQDQQTNEPQPQKIDSGTQKPKKDYSVQGTSDQQKTIEQKRNLEAKNARAKGLKQHAIDSTKKSSRQNPKNSLRRYRERYNSGDDPNGNFDDQ
jgi:hypothetical protein